MNIAYVDTSCLVAIAFAEPGHDGLARRLESFDHLIADNLAEAEFRAALAREGLNQGRDTILSSVNWVFPDRPLTAEYRAVLECGQARGADLRHLACALFLSAKLGQIWFLTADARQRDLASQLAFRA